MDTCNDMDGSQDNYAGERNKIKKNTYCITLHKI